ncbi:MAG: AAA family ATPase, partial [Spirochaetaceae bacterium]|nr:AAA family ATPase [Spirochaetaceae bacterium]
AEVKRSHDSLKIQADKTLAYRRLKDSIFQVECDVYLLRLRQFIRDKDRKDAEFAAKKKERDELKASFDALSQSMSESLDNVNEMEAQLVDLQKKLYGLAVEKNGKEKHKSLMADRIRELQAKIDQLSVRSKAVRDKIAELHEEEAEKEASLADDKAHLRETERHIEEFESGIKAASLALKGNDDEMAKCLASIGKVEAEIAEARVKLDGITETIVQQLDLRLRETGYSSSERKALEEGIDSILASLKGRIKGKTILAADINRARGFPGANASELLAKLVKSLDDLVEASNSLDLLSEKFALYRKSTPAFLDEFLSPEGIMTQKRAIDSAITSGNEAIGKHKVRISELESENHALRQKIDSYRKTLEDARLSRAQAQAQINAAQDALAVFRREITGQEDFLREQEGEIFTEGRRLEELKEEYEDIVSELDEIEAQGKKLSTDMTQLEQTIELRNSDLSQRKKDSVRLSERLQNIQNELETIHLGIAQNETEIKNLRESFIELYSRDLGEFEERMYEIRESLSERRELLTQYKARLRDLGSVNLMAPEEYKDVKERYDFLSGQMEDLRKARDDLQKITDEIRTESADLFLSTYNKIKKNFHNMFRRLFGGGRAELMLSDPDHILESGIEILAQPPGKKLEAISLLSGGEKTLTAIALLFATYMVKPSPFCFLDEIDAALDEANVIRFVNLLREFSKTSQFIVITHNKKTMAGADVLLGVTMEESGVTKAIAIRLERQQSGETTVALAPEDEDESFVDEDVPYEDGRELDAPPAVAAKLEVQGNDGSSENDN